MPTIFQHPSELAAAVGHHLGYSDWLTITQDRVDRFADATGDHQWIHVDPERAKLGLARLDLGLLAGDFFAAFGQRLLAGLSRPAPHFTVRQQGQAAQVTTPPAMLEFTQQVVEAQAQRRSFGIHVAAQH